MTNHIFVVADTHAVQSVPMARVSAYLAAAGATPAGIDTMAANWRAHAGGAAAFHRRAQSTSVIEGRYRGKSR